MPGEPKPAPLTAPEKQILSLVRQGLRDLEIAVALSLEESVVKDRIRTVSDKLDLPDRLQLAIYAKRHNL